MQEFAFAAVFVATRGRGAHQCGEKSSQPSHIRTRRLERNQAWKDVSTPSRQHTQYRMLPLLVCTGGPSSLISQRLGIYSNYTMEDRVTSTRFITLIFRKGKTTRRRDPFTLHILGGVNPLAQVLDVHLLVQNQKNEGHCENRTRDPHFTRVVHCHCAKRPHEYHCQSSKDTLLENKRSLLKQAQLV